MPTETETSTVAPEKVGVIVIHGVGETEAGWINEHLVPKLDKRSAGLTFSRRSEVYRLDDPGQSNSGQHFSAFTRRARMSANREVAFVELFWADLSRVGNNVVSRTLAMMRLFYVAPLVLGHAFLPPGQRGGLALLRWLILAANWLLRWPLTGINAALFFCALVVLGSQWLAGMAGLRYLLPSDWDIAYPLIAILALLTIAAIAFGNWRLHRDIALADIGYSTAACAALLCGGLVLEQFWRAGARTRDFEYLYLASEIFIISAFVWSHVVVAAILVFLALLAWRIVRRASIPLSRPAAALGLTALQAVVWKIAISALWFLIVAAVLSRHQADTKITDMPAFKALVSRQLDLFHVVVFNVGMLVVMLLAIGLLVSTRWGLRTFRRRALTEQRLDLPRLIISPVVIVIIFALTLFNYYSFFGDKFLRLLTAPCELPTGEVTTIIEEVRRWPIKVRNGFWALVGSSGLCGLKISLPMDPYQWAHQLITGQDTPTHNDVLAVLGTLLGGSALTYLITYFRIANRLQEASGGALHIARDVVDHQYTPRYAGINRLQPRSKRQRGYPRRERIRRRLNEVMMEVVAAEKFTRVIFVAHSQGTVILYDYLRSGSSETTLASASRFDIVTLASPLTHIYRHYFHSYDGSFAAAAEVNPKLGSWTNMWRIDDPIGHRIDLVENGFIGNETLPAGGHTNYWRDDRVCEVILSLIDPPSSQGAKAGGSATVG